MLEVAPYDVDEWFYRNVHAMLESICIIQGHQPCIHIPLVSPGMLVITLYVGFWNIVLAEDSVIHLRILISHSLIAIEAERRMVPDSPGHALINIRFDQLRTPPTVIDFNEILYNIVQQTSENRFFRLSGLKRVIGALQNMPSWCEPEVEKIY